MKGSRYGVTGGYYVDVQLKEALAGSASEQVPVEGPCDYGHESSDPIKFGEFLENLRDYRFPYKTLIFGTTIIHLWLISGKQVTVTRQNTTGR